MLATVQAANRFAFRKNQTIKARFYVIVLLNALHPRAGEIEAVKLIVHIYLKLFPEVATDESHSKTLALLLQAVNKIFPLYSERAMLTDNFFHQQLDSLYKFTHFGGNSVLQIQALRFLFQVYSANGEIPDRFYKNLYEHISPLMTLREINHRTLNIFFHTLFLTIKADLHIERVAAFVKRLLQCCLITEPTFICAVLLLVNEVADYHPSVFTLITQTPERDTEESYRDAPDSEEEGAEASSANPETSGHQYDPLKRDPKYAHASRSSLYELTLLGAHYHPTVSKWAKTLLQKQIIEYSGDPLLDFSLINFLDRFNYQQPKPKLVQKLKTHKIRRSLVEGAVNTKDFLLLPEDQVREEERFFHHFFKLKKISQDAAPKYEEEEEEAFSEGSDFEMPGGGLEMQEESEEEESKPKKRQKKSVFSTAEDYAYLMDD